jgi:hypothetical protein
MTQEEVMKLQRCAGCGKPLEAGHEVASISTGKLTRNITLTNEHVWGRMHKACFDRAMPSPNAVLEEMRRQAAGGE